MLLVFYGCVFPLFGKVFLYDIVDNLVCGVTWDSSLSSMPIIQSLGLFVVSHSSRVFLSYVFLFKKLSCSLLELSNSSALLLSHDILSPAYPVHL